MAELALGSQFGGYRIEAIAGRGGMGVVYRATQLALERKVAIKLITPHFADDSEFRERFKRESRLAAAIEHPNVIPVYEAGEHDGALFLAMRFVEGTDLGSLLKREGRVEPLRAARFVAQVAAALDAAHEAGLVHRDVKPANALVAGHDHVYLTDFGLTKRAASASALTKTGQMVGTVDYVAPEQVEGGPVDARTDVYSLGCVLFHLLTGRVPFDKPSEMAKLFAHVNDPPPAPSVTVPGVPPELDEVVARGMAKRAEDRFPSAGDLGRAALAAAECRPTEEPERSVARGAAAPGGHGLAGATTELISPPSTDATVLAEDATAPSKGRRRTTLWVAAGAVAVVIGLGAVVALVTAGGSESDGSSSSGSTVPVTRSGALDSASTFADGVNDENISAFEDLYQGDFAQTIDLKTCTEASQPMDVDGALAEWQCIFDKANDPMMTLRDQKTDLDTGMLTAGYDLTEAGTTFASGNVRFHLIPGEDFPRMDEVVFSAGEGSFAVAGGEGAPVPLTRALGLATVSTFADYYSDENLGGLEELFAPGFTQAIDGPTCGGAKSPMDIDAALAEYGCRFDELALPDMQTSGVIVDLGTSTATGRYTVTDDGKPASSGTFEMHLVPQTEDVQPKIDRLEISES